MKYKISKKHYWAPTPKIVRKVADSILAGATTIATFAAINDHAVLATAVMVVAGISKFLSNFFTNETIN